MVHYPSWVNGRPAFQIDLSDRGLAYGDGLFETIRIHRGRLIWWPEHRQRLISSLQRLQIDLDQIVLEQQVNDYLDQLPLQEGVFKLTVTRGAGGRGYSANGCNKPTLICSAFDLPERRDWQAGIQLYPCVLKMGLNPTLAGMKHLNRLEQVLARSEWSDPAYKEGMLFDLRGHLVEGTMSNLFLVKEGRLYTPDLSLAGVAGIARGQILTRASGWGLEASAADLDLADLAQADGLFCCNSVFGVWPVTACGDQRWSVGPVTRLIQRELNKELND